MEVCGLREQWPCVVTLLECTLSTCYVPARTWGLGFRSLSNVNVN